MSWPRKPAAGPPHDPAAKPRGFNVRVNIALYTKIFTIVKDKGQGCTTQVRRKSAGHARRDPCTRLQRRGACDREGPGVQNRQNYLVASFRYRRTLADLSTCTPSTSCHS